MIGPSPSYLNDKEGYVGGFDHSDITELLDMVEMNFSGWASHSAPIAMNNPESPKLSKELEQTFKVADPVIAREFAEVTFLSDHRGDLSKAMCLFLLCKVRMIVLFR